MNLTLVDNRQVVETLLDEQPDDAVRVEDEVTARRVGVPDDGKQSSKLARAIYKHHRQPTLLKQRRCGGPDRTWFVRLRQNAFLGRLGAWSAVCGGLAVGSSVAMMLYGGAGRRSRS